MVYIRAMRKVLLPVILFLLQACAPDPTEHGVLSRSEQDKVLDHGASLADAAFAALSSTLQQAMAEGGPEHAVDFCNKTAWSLLDSLSVVQGARIRRTSDRPRSLANSPDQHERERLDEVLKHLEAGMGAAYLPAEALVLGDSIAYYKPILIASPLCLKCHGKAGETLDGDALRVIRERYPQDAATGYALGEFRGLWSIRWPR